MLEDESSSSSLFRIHPTCHIFHELGMMDFANLQFLGSGYWRNVWRLEWPETEIANTTTTDGTYSNNNSTSTVAVLKLLNLEQHYDDEMFEMHSVDAGVMERFSSSRNFVHQFAECGPSAITEVADTADKTISNPDLSPLQRLEIARDIAWGLAELHSFQPIHEFTAADKAEEEPKIVLSHHDIKTANVVSVLRRSSGTKRRSVQWNDFNGAIPMRQYANGTRCEYPVHHQHPIWRSPEEIVNRTGTFWVPSADVYSLGNVLYWVLAQHRPWWKFEGRMSKEEREKRAYRKLNGTLPRLPEEIVESTDPATRVLWQAVQDCFQLNPTSRPTAYQLARTLSLAYDEIAARAKG